jgi:cell cycle sensor histidine kinase DivJ
VLDMSKIEAGKFELSEELFDLDEIATQAVRFVKLQADRKGVALKISVAPAAKTVSPTSARSSRCSSISSPMA